MSNVLREITPELIRLVMRNNMLSFDTETTGVNVRKDKVIGFSVSNGAESYYIVHQEWVNGALVEVVSLSLCLSVLRWLPSKKLIMHNAAFDCQMTKNYFGVNLMYAVHADTMLMAHTCNENRFNYGLKELSTEIFGKDEKAQQAALKEHLKEQGAGPKEFYKAKSGVLGSYAAQDAILTYKLYGHFYPLLEKDGLLSFFFNDEVMPLLKHVTIPMQASGIPVDVPYLQSTQAEMASVMSTIEQQIQIAVAPYLGPFNKWFVEKEYKFELNARFKQKLGESLAPELWPRTENGQLSFNASDIKKAKELTKTELKKGITRPLLEDNSLYEQYVTGQLRVPKNLIVQVQLALMADDGVKQPLNVLSKDHWKRVFFGTTTTPSLLNEKPLSKTDKGSPQIDDLFLESVAHKYDWVKLLQQYNSLTKIKSTYVDRFLEGQEDGIFYPAFFQHRTTSGRYSGDLQQLTRVMEENEGDPVVREFNNRIRRFFISGEGHTFADFDYDSQEVKVFAHVSNEQSIKDVFASGDDFYSAVCITAERLTGFSANKKADNYLGKVNKPARQRAKAYALGLAFGMTPYKLKFELNCSEHEAELIYRNYFAAYPNLKAWLERSKKQAYTDGFVKTESGRVRRLTDAPKIMNKWGESILNGLELWKEYHDDGQQYMLAKADARIFSNLLNNAANVQIQGLAASITNRAAIKTAKALKAANLTAYIACITHDQITVRTPDEHLQLVCSILQDSMETAYPISVKLTAPPSWGKNLAESK